MRMTSCALSASFDSYIILYHCDGSFFVLHIFGRFFKKDEVLRSGHLFPASLSFVFFCPGFVREISEGEAEDLEDCLDAIQRPFPRLRRSIPLSQVGFGGLPGWSMESWNREHSGSNKSMQISMNFFTKSMKNPGLSCLYVAGCSICRSFVGCSALMRTSGRSTTSRIEVLYRQDCRLLMSYIFICTWPHLRFENPYTYICIYWYKYRDLFSCMDDLLWFDSFWFMFQWIVLQES